jgi:hypothetical protein
MIRAVHMADHGHSKAGDQNACVELVEIQVPIYSTITEF